MKAGEFHRMFIAVDPTIYVTDAGTNMHPVCFAKSRRELDAKLTQEGWTRNQGFYYAPADWRDRRLVLPTYIAWKEFVVGWYVEDPSNLRTNFLFFSNSEPLARMWAKRMGWHKSGGCWSKQ